MCTNQFPIESPLIKQTIGLLIRRGWDLNPRYKLYTDFRDPHLKPLGHLSFYFILKPTTSNPYDENVFLRKHNLRQYFHFQQAYIYI